MIYFAFVTILSCADGQVRLRPTKRSHDAWIAVPLPGGGVVVHEVHRKDGFLTHREPFT
jgi:hypothetical protein